MNPSDAAKRLIELDTKGVAGILPTPGPWEVASDLPDYAVATSNQPECHPDPIITTNRKYRAPQRKNMGCSLSDATFIAESRNLAPQVAKALLKSISLLKSSLGFMLDAKGHDKIHLKEVEKFLSENS